MSTAFLLALLPAGAAAGAQNEKHGRKYQTPPDLGHIVITVEKAWNGAPLQNAAVIFHTVKDGRDNGNMEIKTDSRGQAAMDFLEVGSHATVQIFAKGYATHAEEFDVTRDDKQILVKLERPRAQVSTYLDTDGKPAETHPGIQEPAHEATATRAATGTTATVSGTLKDPGGARLVGGIVRFHREGSEQGDIQVATDAEGNFRKERVAPGVYEVTLSAPGYRTQTRSRVTLSAGEVRVFHETLQPLESRF